MWNIIFLLTGVAFWLLLLIIILLKKVINSKENQYFKLLVFINGIEYFTEILMQLIVRKFGLSNIIVDIFLKAYLITILAWFSFFSIYTFLICLNKKEEKAFSKIKNINIIFFLLESFLLMILPCQKFYKLDKMYAYGTAVDVLKIFLGIYMLIWIILLIKNFRNIKNKKYAPVFLVVIMLVLNVIVQTIDPSILIASMVGTFICYTMYFTIENPDLKLIRELTVAKAYAEKANNAKSDFLSSMSHEMRTPLNAIVGLSEDNLNYREQVPPQVVENAEDILNASHILLELIGNVLDINKIENNQIDIVEAPYDFKTELTNMLKITSKRLDNKDIVLNYEFSENIPPKILGDKAHVKEIVNNLLTNAIKYTDKGKINVRFDCEVSLDTCKLIISVKDTGKGIKKEDIAKIFNRFERLDVEKNSNIPGTGLSLTITKYLLEKMHGKIEVTSDYQKGSLFIVEIPQKIIKDISDEKHLETPKTKEKRILIVEDDELNAKVVQKTLTSLGFKAEICLSGDECLDLIQKGQKHDLILMDIMMPNMSGDEVLTNLMKIPNFNIPVIAVTADANFGAEEIYKEIGFVDYIAKPFSKNQIKQIINKNIK